MSKVVERAAAAAEAAFWAYGDPDGYPWGMVARAVIEAIREPTDRMTDVAAAGRRLVKTEDELEEDCADTWRDMIDVALE